MPLLVRSVRLSFICGNIIRARRKYVLESWLFVRGAAARFYLVILRVFFVFRLCVRHLSFFVPLSFRLCVFVVCLFVLCVFLFSFPLLCFACFLVSFFPFPFLCFDVVSSNIYNNNIINIYYIISFVCVRTHAHAHAHKDAVNIRHKKGRQKSRPPHVIQKNLLKYKSLLVSVCATR